MEKKEKVQISLETLQQHSGAEGSYWTAINGTVYDFTDFVHEHPGGAKIIRLAGGRYNRRKADCVVSHVFSVFFFSFSLHQEKKCHQTNSADRFYVGVY